MRAQPVPQLLVAALADQVQVELADGRQEAVRVVDRDGAGLAVVDLEPVGERQLRPLHHTLEDAAGVDELEVGRLAVGQQCADGRRAGAVGAHDDPAVGGMGSEDAVRLAVFAMDEALEVLRGGEGHVGSVPARSLRA